MIKERMERKKEAWNYYVTNSAMNELSKEIKENGKGRKVWSKEIN